MPSIVPRTRTASCATAVALREPSTTPASAITVILLACTRSSLPLIGGKVQLGNNWARQRFLFFRPLDSHSVTSSPPIAVPAPLMNLHMASLHWSGPAVAPRRQGFRCPPGSRSRCLRPPLRQWHQPHHR